MTPNEKPVCRDCGGGNILADGTAEWDVIRQEWVLSDIYGCNYYCVDCEQDAKSAEWVEA